MNIKTKFAFGDYIEYKRERELSGGKFQPLPNEIGIINSVTISPSGIVYYGTGFPGGIEESLIITTLEPTK